jgi:undecaprenyl-phosphate 4-deoxy-4-formamido-L-arabinose transferase
MLILSSGVRPLRFVSALGATALVTAIVGSVIIARDVIWGDGDVQGWPSTFVVLLGSSGLILFALGIIAEYLGAVLSVARGRPAFVLRHEDDGDSTS